MTRKKKLKYIDGVCGSGKSYNVMRNIADGLTEGKFILAMPTKQMVHQTANVLRRNFELSNIYGLVSNDGEPSVTELFSIAIRDSSKKHVIVLTHKALEMIGKRILLDGKLCEILGEYVIFVDEVPSPILTAKVSVRVAENHHWLAYLRPVEMEIYEKKRYWFPQDRKRLKSFYSDYQNGDEHTKNAIWIALAGCPLIRSRVSGGGFVIHGYAPSPIMQIARFCKDFYLMSSNVVNSPFARIAYEWFGMELESAPDILQPDAARNRHDSKRILCHAILKKRAGLSSIAKSGIYEDICKESKRLLTSNFIYATNSNKSGAIDCKFQSIADGIFSDVGVRAAYVSHGLNIFGGSNVHGYSEYELEIQGCHDIDLYKNGFQKALWLGVSRLNGEVKSHLREVCQFLGGDSVNIIDAIEVFNSFEAAYQFCLRTKLRDASSTSPVEFVFIDKPTMDYFVNNYAPDAQVGSVGLVSLNSKADETFITVQKLKALGLSKSEVQRETGFSRATVYNHWG